MINLSLNLKFPNCDRFQNMFSKFGSTPFEYKFWEVQLYRSADIFNFEFRISTKEDHAGINLGLGLLGLNFDFNFYDSRHWDHKNNEWHRYDQEF